VAAEAMIMMKNVVAEIIITMMEIAIANKTHY
jgi:hypothetical protein